jgi:ribosomal protein S27E
MSFGSDRPGLSRAQRLITRWVGPQTAAAMEAHSRAWLVQCPHCGHERSIWELGGIRYKAMGNQRNWMRCASCGKVGWHRVHKAANFPATSESSWPLIRFLLCVGLVTLIVIAVVVGAALKLTGAI